jgi:hypothetical protein
VLISDAIINELSTAFAAGGSFSVATVDLDLDPLDFVRAAHGRAAPAIFFGRHGGVEIGAIGSAWEANAAAGTGRLRRLGRQVPDVPGAKLVVGYSFSEDGPTREEWDAFGVARVVLPSAAVIRDGRSTRLVVVAGACATCTNRKCALAGMLPTGPSNRYPPRGTGWKRLPKLWLRSKKALSTR